MGLPPPLLSHTPSTSPYCTEQVAGFKSAGESHKDVTMPPAVVGEKERQIFLAPGGKYTQADIDANKGKVPSQKFQSFVAEHDDNPKPGDWVCPVTHTKANPECSFVRLPMRESACSLATNCINLK